MGVSVRDSTEGRRNPIEYDPENLVYRARYERGHDTPSLAVVEAIAAIEGVDPTEVDPLGRTIDMDALDAIVQPPVDDADVQVSFLVHGYQVTVSSDGRLDLRRTDPDE